MTPSGKVEADVEGDVEAKERIAAGGLGHGGLNEDVPLHQLADSMAFMMGVVEITSDDQDIIHIYDSPATHRFFKMAPGAMRGRSARELGVPDELVAWWVGQYRAAERSGQSQHFEYLHLDGANERWLAPMVSYIGPAAGGRTRFAYVTEDVTERRRAEDRLRDRELHLRFAMEASLAIAFEWDVERDRVRRLTSTERALPETGAATERLNDVARVVHPDDRSLFLRNVHEATRTHDGVYRSEHRVVRPDGEVRWLLETGRVEFDEHHRPIRLLGISQDISERRRAEETIRNQARLIELSHEPILVWSPQAGVVEWNSGATRLFGYTREEALGRDVHELLRAAPALSALPALSTTKGDAEWTGELRYTGKDGQAIVVESRRQAVRMEGRELVLEVDRDITERKRAEEELREADRRKDDFIAVLAHELRNPLAPVRTAVEILRRAGIAEPRVNRARDVIERQVAHMARLIDDLLEVSRIARGRLTLQRQTCDLAAIARQTAEDYRVALEATGLVLVTESPAEPVWVEGDPARLAQMVGNLLNNAGRFTPAGGRIAVATRVAPESRAGEVTVTDTGVGIEPSLLARLFDPFSQAEQGLARTKGGLGLGLALTRGLAELHGGGVRAHSVGAGQGSTFTLVLPLSAARQAAPPAPADTTRPAARLRVLVVEDNRDAAQTLAELLQLSGHEVQIAHDGAEGLTHAHAFRPDAVVCDLGLPGAQDGFDVARALRADPAFRTTRLIALSGYANAEARRRSQLAGFDAHLAKPPDLAALDRALAPANDDTGPERAGGPP